MENSLAPAFVRINYSSAHGIHSMTLPSVPMNIDIGDTQWEFDLRGAAIDVQIEGAVIDFLTVIKPFFLATTTFIDYVAFTKADEESPAVPVESKALGIVGTSGATSWAKAVQTTWAWRADDFGLFKLVFLDVPNDGFDAGHSLVGAARIALDAYVTADVTWLAARSGGRPDVFLQHATTLNEKLRKAYRMN